MRVISFSLLILLTLCSVGFAGYPYHSGFSRHSYVTKEKVVEFDKDYYLGTEGYFAVAEDLKKEHIATELEKDAYYRGKIDALQDIIKGLKGSGGGVVGETPAEKPQNDLESKVLAVYNKYNCIKCHGATKPDGDLSLVDADGKLIKHPLEQIDNIVYRVDGTYLEDGDTTMPKGGKEVSSEDLAVLKSYMVKNMKEKLGQ